MDSRWQEAKQVSRANILFQNRLMLKYRKTSFPKSVAMKVLFLNASYMNY